MGVYGGQGPTVNAVLWVEAVVLFIFVALRLYTRISILNSAGADDCLVVATLILHIIYTVLVHVATGYGLGQRYADVGDANSYNTALMYEIFSQVAGLLALGAGKCAVGTFLFRIVYTKIQAAIVWVFLAATTFITLFASIAVVTQCIPSERIWNPAVEGHCWLDFSIIGFTVGSWFVVADFAFATLPWFILWKLDIKRKEKVTIACGLSLGIFAGMCGIVRTVALSGLNTSEYIYDTVPMLIWSATESLITIICSTIPILRPLYLQIRYRTQNVNSDTPDEKDPYDLPTPPSRSPGLHSISASIDLTQEIDRRCTTTTITSAHPVGSKGDESVIRSVWNKDWTDSSSIKITEEISVSYDDCYYV